MVSEFEWFAELQEWTRVNKGKAGKVGKIRKEVEKRKEKR